MVIREEIQHAVHPFSGTGDLYVLTYIQRVHATSAGLSSFAASSHGSPEPESTINERTNERTNERKREGKTLKQEVQIGLLGLREPCLATGLHAEGMFFYDGREITKKKGAIFFAICVRHAEHRKGGLTQHTQKRTPCRLTQHTKKKTVRFFSYGIVVRIHSGASLYLEFTLTLPVPYIHTYMHAYIKFYLK
jgi:hypothetical protein